MGRCQSSLRCGTKKEELPWEDAQQLRLGLLHWRIYGTPSGARGLGSSYVDGVQSHGRISEGRESLSHRGQLKKEEEIGRTRVKKKNQVIGSQF